MFAVSRLWRARGNTESLMKSERCLELELNAIRNKVVKNYWNSVQGNQENLCKQQLSKSVFTLFLMNSENCLQSGGTRKYFHGTRLAGEWGNSCQLRAPWQQKEFRQPLTRKSQTFRRDHLTWPRQKTFLGVRKSQSATVNSALAFIVFEGTTGVVTSPPRKYFWLANCLRTCRLIYFADDYACQRGNRTFSRNWIFYGLYWLKRTMAFPLRHFFSFSRKAAQFSANAVCFYNLLRLAPFNWRKKA